MTDGRDVSLLVLVLRREQPPAQAWLGIDSQMFCRAAESHGVLPLAAERLLQIADVPIAVRDGCRTAACRTIGPDLMREEELRRLAAALGEAGVPAVFMKGAHLAYTVYDRPDLRPRLDSDLLIPSSRRTAVHDVLVALGYEPQIQSGVEFVVHQRPYAKYHDRGLLHAVDVHWRVANPELFSGLLTFEEAWRGAVPIPALGPSARGLSDAHALLVACVHRVAHHFDQDRLIWLFDIDVLARRLDQDGWRCFGECARAGGVAAVCSASLNRASATFGTPRPAGLLDDLAAGDERTARFLTGGRPHIQLVLDDLRALPTWSDRWRLMREHAFPPVEYMRKIYAPSSRTPLVWLYARRMLLGARKWLAHP